MRLLCWAAGLAAAARRGGVCRHLRDDKTEHAPGAREGPFTAGRARRPPLGALCRPAGRGHRPYQGRRLGGALDNVLRRLRLHGRLLRGEGRRSVLLVHGYHSSGENDFCGIFDYYASRGYNILLIDQRGHGLSEGRELAYGPARAAGRARLGARLAQELGGEIWLHGVSMGGRPC